MTKRRAHNAFAEYPLTSSHRKYTNREWQRAYFNNSHLPKEERDRLADEAYENRNSESDKPSTRPLSLSK